MTGRPSRWWIVGADGKLPRAATRYERVKAASLAVQNAIRAARPAPAAAWDDDPAATAPAAAPTEDHHRKRESDVPHAVEPPGPGRRAHPPAQRAAAAHAHQQAAMPQKYLQGRTTDPATWMRTPKNLERLAALTRAADARRRAVEDRELPDPAAAPTDPVDQRRKEHERQHRQPDPGRGKGIQ